MDNLQKWLQDNQLDKYSEILLQNDITSIELLFELSEDDIKELGFSLGDRKRFTLAKKNILSQEDIELINSLPYVIAYPLKRTLLEKHSWTKINLLKDTFLNYLKYLGLLSASEFFNSDIKDKGMVALFHKNLMETAFGKWNHYIRESLSFLKQKNHAFFYPELVAYYELVETGTKSKKYKGEIEYQDANGDTQLIVQTSITSIGMLINFRNRYLGHGQTLDEDKSQALWNEYYPIFKYLLEQLNFTKDYPMLKREDGETYLLHTAEIKTNKATSNTSSNIWIENKEGQTFDILPFFIVPGEVSLAKEDKEQLLTYESYTGKTIKFFSPEGTEKQTSGKILEKLNLLLRDKQKETLFTPEAFTKEEFLKRIAEENKLLLDTLITEKKIIPGVYQHREEMEIKLREWIGARANIFFIAAEAGSGKTNLLTEIQKQYTERELPSLLIRAGRMEKQTLNQQIAYLLNIDFTKGLEDYTSIAGTQAKPTFILIDGLNEASNAEDIWKEILELSKLFEPGSLKFVVTNRANTKVDLERYIVSDSENDFLYGEAKDNEKGLSAYTYWLTTLDMKEMKGVWENYVAKDKSRFKPLFSFDDIAAFDRALYNQINNPLILRLFLEIYNGKQLPKKGIKHLHVWQDWLNSFSKEEQTFLKLLADEIWLIGKNELLLDDLLKHEKLKPYFTSDIISGPYSRLKNIGWISLYVKDLNGFIGLTVEGALFYLLGIKLTKQMPEINIDFIHTILKNGTKLQKTAIESFLCEQALNGNLDLVTNLIDAGDDDIDLSITPLLFYLKKFGVKATIEKILENPTENDWKALLKLDRQLEELQLHVLRKEFLKDIMPFNQLNQKDEIWLGLKAISVLDIKNTLTYLNKIDAIEKKIFLSDDDTYYLLGKCYESIGNYFKALEYHEKVLEIILNNNGQYHDDAAISYNSIGTLYYLLGNYSKSKTYFEKSIEIYLINNKSESSFLGICYGNLGRVFNSMEDYELALFYQLKCLEIKLKQVGEFHSSVATTYDSLGNIYDSKGDYDLALSYYYKCLDIRLNTNGDNDRSVGTCYNNIGLVYKNKGELDKALNYYNKSIDLNIKCLGENHPSVMTTYGNLASILISQGEYVAAINYLTKCIEVQSESLGILHPDMANLYNNIGIAYVNIQEYDNALNYIEKANSIYIKTLGPEHLELATSFNNIASLSEMQKKYDKAIVFYNKSLNIYIKKMGIDHPDLANIYWDIANCHIELTQFNIATKLLKKGFKILKKGGFLYQIAKCNEKLENKELALKYYILSAELRKKDPDVGLKDESTIESILNAKRIAKELGKENDLPDWMKNE